jgi:membrane carboxypeptidase/penicillin-binding protein PbpC
VPEARRAQIEGTLQADGRFSLPVGVPVARPTARAHIEQLAVTGLGTEQLAMGTVTFVCPDARGTARRMVTGDHEKQWVPPEAFGSWLPAAVLAAEDPRFDSHAGIDETSIVRALSGAPQERGTLTQRLARTLYTGGDVTLAALLRELLYATEMERTLGKDRIVALHLNTVAWGPGACGARAAARLYFGKRVSLLTPLEAAWLAGILRDPQRAWQQQVLGGVVDHERTHSVLAQLRELPRAERDWWRRQSITFNTRGPLPLALAGQTAP